jgi:hypothetical protein
MTLHTGLPGRRFAVRLRRPSISSEHEFDQEAVLFDDPELVAFLADDVPMPGKFPSRVRLLHQVAAIAKLRVLLDIGVIADRKDDAEDADNEQDRNKNGLIARAEPTVEFIEQVFEEFDHPE